MSERHKLLTWSRLRSVYTALFLVAFVLTEVGRFIYRPLVYGTGLNDCGIADTMGNHLGTVTLVFFILAVMHATRQEGFIVIAVVTCGYVSYEFAQRFLVGSTADVKDVVATLVGGALSLAIFLVTQRFVQTSR